MREHLRTHKTFSVLHVFGVIGSVTFYLTCVYIILVRVELLSGRLLGKSCSLGLPYFSFGFEGWIWVLIASVPDPCILFYFNSKSYIEGFFLP